jgi:dephospho-CoA kinase
LLRIVAVTGMPGAGKSTASEALVRSGWKKVVMGDVIRNETRRRGLEPDAKNTGRVMKELREQGGDAAVADLCLQEIERTHSEMVVVDGIRSVAEVEAFRRKAPVLLVAVHASPERRFSLLTVRGRSDDPDSREAFSKRDERELSVGIGNAIALADEVLVNERSTPAKLATAMKEAVDRWVESLGP